MQQKKVGGGKDCKNSSGTWEKDEDPGRARVWLSRDGKKDTVRRLCGKIICNKISSKDLLSLLVKMRGRRDVLGKERPHRH